MIKKSSTLLVLSSCLIFLFTLCLDYQVCLAEGREVAILTVFAKKESNGKPLKGVPIQATCQETGNVYNGVTGRDGKVPLEVTCYTSEHKKLHYRIVATYKGQQKEKWQKTSHYCGKVRFVGFIFDARDEKD